MSAASVCPSCGASGRLEPSAPEGLVAASPPVSGTLLRCGACHEFSVLPGIAGRLIGLVLLVPFLLLLMAGAATGLFLVFSMTTTGTSSAAFWAIGVLLTAGGGFFGFRTLRTITRLLFPRPLPLFGAGTRI